MLRVALSGCGRDEDRRRAVDAGSDRRLIKPVNLAQLSEPPRIPSRSPFGAPLRPDAERILAAAPSRTLRQGFPANVGTLEKSFS
jgi:hypothetical protein